LKERLAPYWRTLLVTLGWGTSFGAITLWAIFQGLLLPNFTTGPPPEVQQTETMRLALYYSTVLGLSVLSGVLIADLGKTIGGFAGSYLLGGIIVFLVLSAPNLSDATLSGLRLYLTRQGLDKISLDLTFRVLFPLPIFVLLLGGILGGALEEHYL